MVTAATKTQVPKAQRDGTADTGRYLIFALAGDQFAVEVPRLLQIRSWGTVTAKPDTPDYVLGVTDRQGAELYIVDLRRRLALPDIPPSPRTLVVVLRFACNGVTLPIGFAVDGVSGVHKLANEVASPSQELLSPVSREFVRGTAMVNDEQVILLETDRLVEQSVLAREATTRLQDSRRIH